MSSFRGNDIFGSGPHRVTAPARRLLVIPKWVQFQQPHDDGTGSEVTGAKEEIMSVSGRLVAPDEATLWALREAVAAEAELPEKKGDLIDNDGRTWAAMTMISYEELGVVDRGRVWSVRYEATFRRVTH
ncbi:MAG: hypothetical protein DHS20C14_14910 [Phycisphaeraceae bacterium]|nr:MAG: hypothetical protein DHS20C14_14910 [Phycisphaeraceae bacterium]